jgi:hypothetical protein
VRPAIDSFLRQAFDPDAINKNVHPIRNHALFYVLTRAEDARNGFLNCRLSTEVVSNNLLLESRDGLTSVLTPGAGIPNPSLRETNSYFLTQLSRRNAKSS